MNRLMLANFSVFTLTIAAPSVQDTIVTTSPARDNNPQVSNNPLIDSRLVIATRPPSSDSSLSDRGNRTSNIIATKPPSDDPNNPTGDYRDVSGC